MQTPTKLPRRSHNEMLCTKHIIVFTPGNSFHIVLADEIQCSLRWRGHYTSPDNTIAKAFPQEKAIIEYHSQRNLETGSDC